MRRERGKLFHEPARRVVKAETVRTDGSFTKSVKKTLDSLRDDAAAVFMHRGTEDGVEYHFVLEIVTPEKKT